MATTIEVLVFSAVSSFYISHHAVSKPMRSCLSNSLLRYVDAVLDRSVVLVSLHSISTPLAFLCFRHDLRGDDAYWTRLKLLTSKPLRCVFPSVFLMIYASLFCLLCFPFNRFSLF